MKTIQDLVNVLKVQVVDAKRILGPDFNALIDTVEIFIVELEIEMKENPDAIKPV